MLTNVRTSNVDMKLDYLTIATSPMPSRCKDMLKSIFRFSEGLLLAAHCLLLSKVGSANGVQQEGASQTAYRIVSRFRLS